MRGPVAHLAVALGVWVRVPQRAEHLVLVFRHGVIDARAGSGGTGSHIELQLRPVSTVEAQRLGRENTWARLRVILDCNSDLRTRVTLDEEVALVGLPTIENEAFVAEAAVRYASSARAR